MMALRCVEQFPVLCAQVEYGDITWQAGAKQIGIRRPAPKLKELLPLTDERASGNAQFTIELNGNSTSDATLEWLSTGEERRLLVLTPGARN